MAQPDPPATRDPGAPSPGQPELSTEERDYWRAEGGRWQVGSRTEAGPGVALDLDAVEMRGSRPGERYVRVIRTEQEGFQRVAPGWLEATPRAGASHSGRARAVLRIRRTVLGAPMMTRQFSHERLAKLKALPVLSSDALSSVAYATEQITTVLVLAGVGALGAELGVMSVIVLLLFAVVLSYRQTIKAYPKGGGSYIVAKDNLGPLAGLIAASALMTDYVLTVAVSVASGWDQIESAFPAATRFAVVACVGMVVLIALGNLRGLREAGTIFALPTYLFIASMLLTVAVIGFKLMTGQLHQVAPHNLYPAIDNLSIFLVLRAFSSGCSAMTGVEAISDGVMAFKAPEWRNARITLTIMGALLAVMFIGITVCSHILGFVAYDTTLSADYAAHGINLATYHYNSIISQLAGAAFGSSSVAYFVVIAATTAILVLAANTAFSDFPRLFFFLARDSYAPHQFGRLGDRLAYSNGIIVLTLLACILLMVFDANVNALIPLYAIGVFLAFTLSQMGMVVRWLRRREPGWQRGLPLNFFGMCLTAVVFVVTAVTKFTSGAWIILFIIPGLVMLFRAIHGHYQDAGRQVTLELPTSPSELHPLCIVPISDLNRVALQSLAMARSMSDAVVAVHVCDDEDHIRRLRERWDVWGNHVPLTVLESPYRSTLRPLLGYIDALDHQRIGSTIMVVLPELVATRWWHQVLHNQSALRLKAALLFRPGTVVVSVPYHLRHDGGGHRGEDPDAI